MENYEIINPIGKGHFGIISKIFRKSDKKILVWKEINYSQITDKEKQQIVSEVNILRELKHPNIVRYYDRIIDKKNQKIYIIMEYCEKGDLNQLIKKLKKQKDYLSENKIWEIFSQVLLAVNYCHNHKEGKILHRDIKPSNIFIDKDNNIKLGDFGLSRELSNESKFAYSHVGTPYYMSPEQIEENKYNEKSDIWSLGCFLYELCTFNPPFEAKNHIQLALKIKSGKIDKSNFKYSDNLWNIIKSMINVNVIDRPFSYDLINFSQVNICLREREVKEYYYRIKAFEIELKNKERDLEIMKKELLEREKKIVERENELNEKEKILNELNYKIISGKNNDSTNISSENNYNNNIGHTPQNSNLESNILTSYSILNSHRNSIINQNNFNDEKNDESNNNEENIDDNEKYCILLPSDTKKSKSLTVPISVNSSIKFDEKFYQNYGNNRLKCNLNNVNFKNMYSNNPQSKINNNILKQYLITPNFNPNTIKKDKYDNIKNNDINYQMKQNLKSKESNKFKTNIVVTNKNNLQIHNDESVNPSRNIKTESNKKMLEKGFFKKRANTPNLTAFTSRCTTNNTPTKKLLNNNLNSNNNISNTYYSKYVRRNNSGVSINRFIDINRINSNNKKKNSYRCMIPRNHH
jgi:NIMA (never in mitosis gene a)-related kinase